MTLRLKARVDLPTAQARLAVTGRVRLPDFLDPSSAASVAAALAETPWQSVLNQGERHFDLHAMQLEALSLPARESLARTVTAGGMAGFQYLFDNYPLFDAVRAHAPVPNTLMALHDLVAGPDFLALARALTGNDAIAFADMQVTRYRPGHFLTAHDDAVDGKGRLYAYVLGMTRNWRADWGGVLVFLDDAGDIAEGFTPAFNSLTVFRVPQAHAVSMVTPLAPRPRYAVTGWLRTGAPG